MPQFQCTVTRSEGRKAGDADEFRFEFAMVPAEKVGQPSEPGARTTGRVTVNISRTVLHGWGLDATPDAALRVAFFYAVEAGIAEGKDNVTLRSGNVAEICPYDPNHPIPTGPFTIEIPSPPIGFRA